MSNRAATILAVAAVISSLCIYGTLAQDRPQAPAPEDAAIVVGPPPIRLQQELPGRYQLAATSSSAGSVTVIVLDTHTGHCWWKSSGQSWHDAGAPVKRDANARLGPAAPGAAAHFWPPGYAGPLERSTSQQSERERVHWRSR